MIMILNYVLHNFRNRRDSLYSPKNTSVSRKIIFCGTQRRKYNISLHSQECSVLIGLRSALAQPTANQEVVLFMKPAVQI